MVANSIDLDLADDCAFYHHDPYGWVLWAFDWGHGELEGFDGPDEWQKEWLIQWGEETHKLNFDGVTPVTAVRMTTASGHGIGKAFRNNDLALTPTGIRRWGDLKPGDQLFDENGAPIRILQTHHYTNIPMYRVTFDDRSHMDVSSGHLWDVRGRQERRKGISTWRTMETIEILEQGVKRPNGTAQARQWEIPVQGAAQFEECEVDLHPYLVGVWLGDGSKGLPRYCKPFDEIADKIRSLGYDVTDCKDGKSKYIPNITHLMTEPVFQLGSHERYIPDDYKFNTVDNRMALFCGLCDTDGEVHKSGSIGYSTTSEKLANDMVWLARSLGCKAMIHPTIKNGWYRVTINAPFNPFTLKHRRAAYKPSESRYLKRWIESIEPVGYDNGMCVTVDSEAGLYLTDQFHVTHNSALVAWIILFIQSTRPQSKGIVTANTGDQLRTKTWGELAVWKARCITGHWFTLNSGKGSLSMYHKGWPSTWRVDAMTSQKENSEAFAGLHCATSSPFYIFDESCHDDQTEVMTRSGWKLFKDTTLNDQMLTMDTVTRRAYYDKPSYIHASEYDGELLTSDVRGCNFAVTPTHRMLFESIKRLQLQFQEAGVMKWNNKKMMRHIEWTGVRVDEFTIPPYETRRVRHPSHTVKMDDWLELLGWFITEGHVATQTWTTKSGKVNTEFTCVVITQKQKDYTDEIEDCVRRLNLPYTRRDTGIWINSVALASYMNTNIGKGFDGKRVPEYLYELTPTQIKVFLDTAVKGDGYYNRNRDILYTSSPELAQDYNRLALLTGVNSTVNKRSIKGEENWIIDHIAVSSCDGYFVSISHEPTYISCYAAEPVRIQYKGMVYCATISGGVLYTRRNGYTLWSGNSNIANEIWEVAEGGLTDGEPFFFAFGNPTRTKGKFAETLAASSRWIVRQIDSRTAKMTNKAQIDEWLEDHGEDSDFFRVRVRGMLPRAGDMQFVPSDIVYAARKRTVRYIHDDPLICSIDMARGGADNCRIGFRRGYDAKSEKSYRIPGEKSRDSMKVVSMLTMILNRHQPDVTFIDATGLGGPVGDRLRQLGYHVIDIHFGGDADDKKLYANKTAEMGARYRQWLMDGGSIPDDPQLDNEITVREFWHDDADRLVLERKKDLIKRLKVSPDWADQQYLLFAQHVAPLQTPRGMLDVSPQAREHMNKGSKDYDPLANM